MQEVTILQEEVDRVKRAVEKTLEGKLKYPVEISNDVAIILAQNKLYNGGMIWLDGNPLRKADIKLHLDIR